MNTLLGLMSLSALIGATALALALFPALSRSVMGDDPADRVDAMDGLRGILAISVILHHSIIAQAYAGGFGWCAPASNFDNLLGRASVAVFFMISAYLFWGRVLRSPDRIDWIAFFRGRLLRLTPMYCVAVTMLLAIVFVETQGVLRVPLATLTVQIARWYSYAFLGNPNVNGLPDTSTILAVLWSLKYEWIFYLSLPVLAVVYRSVRAVWPLYVAVFGLSMVGGGWAFYGFFVGGAIAVHVLRNRRYCGRVRLAWAAAGLCGLVLLFGLFHDVEGPIQVLLLFPVFVAALLAAGPWLILRCRALRFFGHISYSIYLIHTPIIHIVTNWVVRPSIFAGLGRYQFYSVVVAIGIVSISVSTLTFLLFEQPFLGAKRALDPKQAVRPNPVRA